jgi:hypothetical protein
MSNAHRAFNTPQSRVSADSSWWFRVKIGQSDLFIIALPGTQLLIVVVPYNDRFTEQAITKK